MLCCVFIRLRPTPSSTLFPYTTLFRSKDIITGKRWYAHGSKGDAEPKANPVLYWFELKRADGKVDWIPHQIDDNSGVRSEEHTSELQSQSNLVCRLLLEKKKQLH